MPKIIKGGINFTPEVEQVQVDEQTIIFNSEGKLEAIQQELPLPDGITITESNNVWSAVQQTIPNSDWLAEENSEGYIKNKPSITLGNDYFRYGVIIGDKNSNVASGEYSVAEGSATTASGLRSHAEGYLTVASGNNSHTEGEGTQALANNSHAEGVGTITPNIVGAHVQGKYNANLSNSNFIDIVGYGDNNTNRKNISALTTDGRLILSKGLTIGADAQSQGGYTIEVPEGVVSGKTYLLTLHPETNNAIWEEFQAPSVEEDTQRYRSSLTSVTGPFTIYDGTTDPADTLGKVGDIYFKHS